MSKIFWIALLLFAYIWTVSTGHEQMVFDQSKQLYQYVTAWFSDAKVDYQVKKEVQPIKKKRSRRWD